MTRVVIAASSPVVRAGLEALLAGAAGAETVGVLPDLSGVETLRPDVVLAAVSPDQLTPLNDGYAPAIVLLSGADAPQWTAEFLRLGVRAVLPRAASAGAIVAAVEAVANGLALIDPQELETLLGSPYTTHAASAAMDGVSPLTPRELSVLRMMADGAANKEIAFKLAISEHTVKFHVASILTKLNASSRTEAVTRGLRQGLILI